ncbi:MAG: SCP2 sterol-binding domain-containing protein [Rhodocyclaceae bacterium]|nr:SCP2 sterol-binding domain-containing protein [Rhodocyclaceae bacterium]MDP3033413.1 SCP2 sterol-binding domain-containing protein [Rhodocyclaceae bacterium]
MMNFKLPDFAIPAPLTRLGNRLPQLPPTLALVTALNLALDRLIPREPLEMLIGKRFTIRVLDAGMTLRFSYGERGFRPLFDASQPDLTISARTRDFIALLAREEDPDTLFFDRRLLMEGDTDLGLLVKNTLDGIELPRFDPARLTPQELLHRLRARLATPHST